MGVSDKLSVRMLHFTTFYKMYGYNLQLFTILGCGTDKLSGFFYTKKIDFDKNVCICLTPSPQNSPSHPIKDTILL